MPFHPFAIHFPIAGLLFALFFQGLYLWRRAAWFRDAALILFALAVAGALVAALSGTAQESQLASLPHLSEPLARHSRMGNLFTWLMAASGIATLYLKLKGGPLGWDLFSLLLLLSVLAVWTSHLGGVLVFQFGGGVSSPPLLAP